MHTCNTLSKWVSATLAIQVSQLAAKQLWIHVTHPIHSVLKYSHTIVSVGGRGRGRRGGGGEGERRGREEGRQRRQRGGRGRCKWEFGVSETKQVRGWEWGDGEWDEKGRERGIERSGDVLANL